MNERIILNQKWDKFVGRRQPPLRGYLIYEGFVEWLNKRYNYNFSNIFLFFCERKENDAIADSFVNTKLKEKMIDFIVADISNQVTQLHNNIAEFRTATSELFEFSKNLSDSKEELITLFDKFCKLWKRFGPSLAC